MAGIVQSVVDLVLWFVNLLSSLWRRVSSSTLKLDTGLRVSVGRKIAEGGFSFVFEATDSKGTKYALKRIHVGDREVLSSCKNEVGVHRALRHPHLMPLLGMCHKDPAFYMLFPFMPRSLRSHVNQYVFDQTPSQKPMEELLVLRLFHQLLSAVATMHATNFSHRDIKLENVLLKDSKTAVLMDFGSVGPVLQSLATRKDVMEVAERASQHTTLPYRPPELLEGNLRAGDPPLNYALVDVWSLGCTIFAMMFGASPFECEFRKHSGELRVVDCTQLRILGSPSMPPRQTDIGRWYSVDLLRIIENMLLLDRAQRPSVDAVTEQVERLIRQQGGRVPTIQRPTTGSSVPTNDHDLDDLFGGDRAGFV